MQKTMKAAVVHGFRKPLEVEEVPATSCMRQGQQRAKEWLDEHPKWALGGWRCKFGPQEQ